MKSLASYTRGFVWVALILGHSIPSKSQLLDDTGLSRTHTPAPAPENGVASLLENVPSEDSLFHHHHSSGGWHPYFCNSLNATRTLIVSIPHLPAEEAGLTDFQTPNNLTWKVRYWFTCTTPDPTNPKNFNWGHAVLNPPWDNASFGIANWSLVNTWSDGYDWHIYALFAMPLSSDQTIVVNLAWKERFKDKVGAWISIKSGDTNCGVFWKGHDLASSAYSYIWHMDQ